MKFAYGVRLNRGVALYVGYTLSNLFLTLLALSFTNDFGGADRLTLIIGFSSSGSGVVMSVLSAFLLPSRAASLRINLSQKKVVMLVAALSCGIVSALLALTILGIVYAISLIFNVGSIGLNVYRELALLSFAMGAGVFFQVLFQANMRVYDFYKLSICSAVISMLLGVFMYHIFGYGYVAVGCLILRSLLISGIAAWVKFPTPQASIMRADLNKVGLKDFSGAMGLLASGTISKVSFPYDRVLLTFLGDGIATVYHVISLTFSLIAKFVDVNIFYKMYRQDEKTFFKNLPLVGGLLALALAFWTVACGVSAYTISQGLGLFSLADGFFSISGLFVVTLVSIVSLPGVVSVVFNTFLLQPLYAAGRHSFVARTAVISSVVGLSLKTIALVNAQFLFIPMVLGVQFVLMIFILYPIARREVGFV